MSITVQKQIRDNSKSIQGMMDDLYHWSDGMKKAENQLRGNVPKDGPTQYAKIDNCNNHNECSTKSGTNSKDGKSLSGKKKIQAENLKKEK